MIKPLNFLGTVSKRLVLCVVLGTGFLATVGAAQESATQESAAVGAQIDADASTRGVRPFANTDPVRSLDISPDGKLLATGGRGTTTLWDLKTGKPMRTLAQTTDGNPPGD